MAIQTIRNYQIIGGPFPGNNGVVYIGQNRNLPKMKKAFKKLHPFLLPNIIRDEAEKQMKVKSPYVVKVDDFFEEDGVGIIQIEY